MAMPFRTVLFAVGCVFFAASELAETRSSSDLDLADSPTVADSGTAFGTMLRELNAELAEPQLSHQIFNAVAALALGVFMLLEGEIAFKQIVCLCIFVLSTILTTANLKLHNKDSTVSIYGIYIISFEVGVVFFIGAWRGFPGVMILLGAACGLSVAEMVNRVLFLLFNGSAVYVVLGCPAVLVIGGSLFAFGGVAVLRSKKSKNIQAFLGACVGGCLVSSVFGYFVSLFVHLSGAHINGLETPAVPSPWVDFAKLLVAPISMHGKVGLFAGSDYEKGNPVPIDFILGGSFWAIIGVLGFRYQLKQIRTGDRRFADVMKRMEDNATGTINKINSKLEEKTGIQTPLLTAPLPAPPSNKTKNVQPA